MDNKDITAIAYQLFEEFREAYSNEWERLENCERMYRGDHWYGVASGDANEPQPVTPILQSSIENVAADLLDSFPEAIIQPESPEDERLARIIEAIIRQNHDAADYKRDWWRLAHDLLVGGYMVQEVGYDSALNNGLGGAFIRYADNRNIMFDPLVTNIQDSRAVIKFTVKSLAWLDEHYPSLAPFSTDEYTSAKDDVLNADETKKTLLIEYWWREFDTQAAKHKIHMCKMANKKIVEDSRTEKPDGYFSHGRYPFVITPLFIRKGSCLGYGFVDMFEKSQRYSDKLDQIVLKNTLMAAKNKLLVTDSSGFDVDDLRDWSKEVHVGSNLNGITWFQTAPLPQHILQYVAQIRQTIKEESGANDFSRGQGGGGVTAASAIAALQDAAGKRSRMAANQMQAAYKEAVRLEIETEREYNVMPRQVLLSIDGKQETATFEAALMERTTKLGNIVPIEFFVSIKVQRENRWSVMAHNELVLQMVQLGIIAPPQAVELMQFEGKESILSKVKQQAPQEQLQQEQMAEQMQQLPPPEAMIQQPREEI